MRTIHSQLAEIKKSAEVIRSITENYSCGFITIVEMLAQIQTIQNGINGTKAEIEIEYGINTQAVDLMLTM
jgi:hypothetical protein